jgi:hypothetical protein
MDARAKTTALGGRWQGSFGLCRCPSHEDGTPSLKVSDDPRKADGIDVHCFAGCDWRDVKTELLRQGLLPSFQNGSHSCPVTSETDSLGTIGRPENDGLRRASNIWRASVPLKDTPAETYFTEVRGLAFGGLELHHALRWHPDLHAVIGGMADPITGIGCGVHRTFLNPDSSKRERMMLGKAGVVMLTPDEDVTLRLTSRKVSRMGWRCWSMAELPCGRPARLALWRRSRCWAASRL